MDPGGSHTPGDSSSDNNYELVAPIGYLNSSSCGYCGQGGESRSKRFSYYVNATSLSPTFYQTLLDRYWRRSGMLMYRPDQRKACCPHYTIRLDSGAFKPSRTQRQAINRFNKFVLGDEYIKETARLHPRSREEAKRRDNEFHFTERIHEAEFGLLRTPPEPAHKFVVNLEEADFTEEKYEVYNNYQRIVHNDAPSERTRGSFKRFLCKSPLRRYDMTGPDGRNRRLGSFHQCYRLDGKLVAMGVLDLLPQCVSSVYFVYDESIHKFTPGKLSALHEISLAIEGGYRWWYPGFYIHSCPKMRYKIDYSPQYILDPETLHWDPLDQSVLDLLDKKPFISLSLERQSVSGSNIEANGADVAANNEDGSDATTADANGEAAEHSLFRSTMPGIPSVALMKTVDLENIAIRIANGGPVYLTSDMVAWNSGGITDWPGIQAMVAEMVAAMGVDVTQDICLDLGRK